MFQARSDGETYSWANEPQQHCGFISPGEGFGTMRLHQDAVALHDCTVVTSQEVQICTIEQQGECTPKCRVFRSLSGVLYLFPHAFFPAGVLEAVESERAVVRAFASAPGDQMTALRSESK